MRAGVVIVGAGHGGAQAAIALRQRGLADPITLIGDEPEPPYERPPLSKDYLAGLKAWDRMLIRPVSFWRERDVTLVAGTRVTSVRPVERRVEAADGRAWPYDALIWAAGGRARRLLCEGGDLANVHTIRSRADVDLLRAELPHARRAVVVGGGYIGLEVAAVLVTLGLEVELVEAQPRLLARVAGPALSDFYAAEHRARGVRLHLGAGVDALEGESGRVTAVRLAGGQRLAAALAIVGVGILPTVEPLLAAGAIGTNGVDVDEACRTSLPNVFAVGDCAAALSPWADGERVRVESVGNANDQAGLVADALTGAPPKPQPVPWFWSNQYDLKLQTVGLSAGHDEAIVRGRPERRSWSVVYRRGGAVVALDCVNATKDFVAGRKLVEARARVPAERLADAGLPLKALV